MVQHHYDQFINHLTLCIGVQKGGTSSLLKTLHHTNQISTSPVELHYFDWKLSKHEHDMDSFHHALNSFYLNGLSVKKFINILLSRIRYQELTDNNNTHLTIFEKTPSNILYPHIAYILAHDMIKYGLKIIILLRNPIKRFISSYFHEKQHLNIYQQLNKTYLWNNGINGYINNIIYNDKINGNQSFVKFNNDINELYDQYFAIDSKQLILMKMVERYKEFLYFYIKTYNIKSIKGRSRINKHMHSLYIFYFIWIRSCYSPQIITWLYYIEKLNNNYYSKKYKHSLKIIQSEQYYDYNTFHKTINYLLCYMHFNIDNNDNYQKWINQCVEKDIYNSIDIKEIELNSKTKDFKPNKQQIDKLNNSFSICNKWLYLLFQQKYDYVILENFNWTLWLSESQFF